MFKRSFYLFLGILLSISSGSVFIYPTYSYYIKNKFKYSLRQINLYATFINIGVWIAFCMGLIYDSFGPRISNIITFLLLFGGFFLLLLLIKASSSSLFLFLFVAFIIGQGSSLAYTNALSTNIKNFSKKNSSNLIGLIISNSAIAPSIFGSIKSSFNFNDITNFISFVLSYIFIIIIINIICFNRIKQKNHDQFRDKLFYEFKQKFIVYIFSYANFIAIVLFIILLYINHIFGWNLPSFFMFIVLHITFIVFILMENQKKFDDWLLNKFNLTHQRTNININNRFENIERNVDIIKKENSENYEINKSEIKKINIKEKGDINEDDENNDNDKKIYSESACISKIKDKFELNKKDEDDDNKKENTLNINIGHDIIRKSLEFNENINNIAEYNKNINGRISIESNKEENKDENKEENEENINKDENSLENNKENNKESNKENNKENNNENNNEINEEKGNNINNNKDIKNENSNLEKSIENINNHQIKELDNKSIDNGEKINKSVNENNNNLKEEKLDENNIVNYPKFSINSSNNNNNEDINNQNNYPKFSISSNKTESEENPYKEKEEEKLKFSIINKEENKKKENNNINNNRESNISEQNKYPIYDENIINNNNKEIKKETNKIFNKNEKDNNKNLTSKPINTSYNNNVTTEIKFITENNNNNIININNSFLPLNNTLNLFEPEEKEDDNVEKISRCVFLLTLFRRRQIIILFFVLVLTMGSMISNVNNIKYIVVSIDPSKDISSISLDKYPLLYFAFNSLTRIVIGSISTSLMGTDETFYILISITIIGFISQVFGFFMTKFFVYLSISLAGMTHGGIMTFVPLYCRYYFSLKNLGTVLGFLTTGNAIGSIIIATFIFPSFYHKYSIYNNSGEEICTIKKCFQYSYGINCLFIICAILLSYSLYKEDKIKKMKERKEKENIYRNNVLCSFG